MTQRRKQTGTDGLEQPVRVYKYIALTFLAITIGLFGVIFFLSTKRAVITIEAKEEPVDTQATVTLSQTLRDDGLRGIVTTTYIARSEEFQPTGTLEEDGVATGVVTLYNTSRVSQPLVKTTRVLSPDGVLFRLKQQTVVPAQGNVDVEVYADKPGKQGNIGPTTFTIPGLPTDRQVEVYGKSVSAMTGGVRSIGVLSTDDMERARKKFLDTIEAEAKNVFHAAYPGYVGAVLIRGEDIQSSVSIGEEVERFTLTGTATVVGALYTEETITAWAKAKLAKRALHDTESITPSDTAPTVSIANYYPERNEVDLSVFIDGIATLNINSPALQKSMFFGKDKDEVRRYALSLDHVRGVDISFSPAWIRTVPFLDDHVTIMVKNVK